MSQATQRGSGPYRGLLRSLPLLALAAAAAQADGTLMRYPALHGDSLVFEAYGNLWRVARAGGTAQRLTADPGFDLMPRYSPDGRWIAFTGEYQRNTDVYVMPAAGGTARRLTFHSDTVDAPPLRWGPDNMVVTWTPDSRNIVFLSRREAFNNWFGRLYTVPVEGGAQAPLPLDRGGMLSYGPDGHSIAYNRIFRNFRTWKRYSGGLNQNIDLYDFDTGKLQSVTDWSGTETDPMWYGDTIYFLSDHDASRRANIWAYDLKTRQFRELTHFTDYDVDWPSLGQGGGSEAGIVFQQGGSLYVLDLPGEQIHKLEVTVPDDGTRTGPDFVDASKQIRAFALAPNGKRAAFEARGDIYSVPERYGNTRNLTASSGANERYPSWSPDGRSVAYVTDAGGQEQVAVRPADGGPEKVLTRFKTGYFYQPVWAPDSDRLIFSDNERRLWLVSANGGEPLQVAQDKYQEMHDYAWSPDGRWLAYSITEANQLRGLWLYRIDGAVPSRLSDGLSDDHEPVFDPQGKYLYFISARHENPALSESEFNIATLKTTGVYVATLSAVEPSPFAPKSDEGRAEPAKEAHKQEDGDDKDHKDGKDGKGGKEWKAGSIKPIRIDLPGLLARALPLPIEAADYDGLAASRGHVFYLTTPIQMIEGALAGEKARIHVFDLDKRQDKVVVDDVVPDKGYDLSADGSRVLYQKDKTGYYIAEAKADGGKPASDGDDDAGARLLDLKHMRAQVDPRQEWREMYDQAWRLQRSFFYNTNMNGVDWDAAGARYRALLPLAGSRQDLSYLIGEMLGELDNSHTYVGNPDGDGDRVGTGLLGVDFALDAAAGRYRIARIYPGDNTRDDYRSPLTEPGVEVHPGDYLLAVDGRELRAPTDPYSLFVDRVDGTVTLSVAATPDGQRREVVVKPVQSELKLRLKDWIDGNRAKVERASGGRIGYIYLSDMGGLGMEQFVRQFYPQLRKQGLIIDDRWNGGGFIDQIVLERLRRVLVGMDTDRQHNTLPTPQQVFNGYMATLINEYSASDGDIFPFYFRKYGLGPLIGKRTWGGVRGIRGDWPLLDGGYITIPEDATYGLDSQWVIENKGVTPDVEVQTEPADMLAGKDAQLQAAVDYLLKQIAGHPKTLPPAPELLPAYPPAGHE
ncbi:MAG: PDZ domain-containing protein [Nevskia sp.]|nr:PDZ domain-containing protein [Nevskia sp.]